MHAQAVVGFLLLSVIKSELGPALYGLMVLARCTVVLAKTSRLLVLLFILSQSNLSLGKLILTNFKK